MSERCFKQAAFEGIPCETEKKLVKKLSELNDKTSAAISRLEKHLKEIDQEKVIEASKAMAHIIIPDMEEIRKYVDEMETLTSSDYWPYPSYYDILYGVK